MTRSELDHGLSRRVTPVSIEIEADLGDRVPAGVTAWSLAQANAWLEGPARLIVSRDGQVRIRAEVARPADLDAGPEWSGASNKLMEEDAVRALCHAVRSAQGAVQRLLEKGARDVSAEAVLDVDLSRRSAELCTEAGWACSLRDAGGASVMVASIPSQITRTASGAPAVVVPLCDVSGFPEPSLEAVGLLLLGVGSWLRSVKGAAMNIEGVTMAVLASATEGLSSKAEVERGLGALTVGCRHVVEVLQALEHPSLARQYLTRRQWRHSAAESPAPHEQQQTEDSCLQVP